MIVNPLTEGYLSCDNYRTFWIGWSADEIYIGRGDVLGEDQFMGWTNPDPFDINYMFVSTGMGATGDWDIYWCKMKGTIVFDYIRANGRLHNSCTFVYHTP